MQIAWVFPGQGSQKLGMGKDVITLEGAKKRFDSVSYTHLTLPTSNGV